LGASIGKLGHQAGKVASATKDFSAKRLDVKPDGGFDIGEGFLVTVAFAHHHAFQAKRVGYIAVRVLLHDDFDLPHHVLS
jgi:hypothetical protein